MRKDLLYDTRLGVCAVALYAHQWRVVALGLAYKIQTDSEY